jgi:hypothetical protein
MSLVIAPLSPASAQAATAKLAGDTITRTQVAPGIEHLRVVRNAGPFVINVLRINRRTANIRFEHARAKDALAGREKMSAMIERRAAAGATVIAAINADFFSLKTGESENNQVIGGEWWKGVKVADSPNHTFPVTHSQFGVDARGMPLLDRFVFEGSVRAGERVLPLITLNSNPSGTPEGTALYTWRYGTVTPRDTVRATVEQVVMEAGRRGDTLLYVRRGAPLGASGSVIPPLGAVLAGYGARSKQVAAFADTDTLKVLLGVLPSQSKHPVELVIGGWPRILRDGENVAGRAATDEGTLSGNAEVRHPRSAIGFSRDSNTVDLVVVDGRSDKSVGMTLVELAGLMQELGLAQAMNFDGGGSSALIVKGHITNSPSDKTGEREVGNALLVLTRPKPAGR